MRIYLAGTPGHIERELYWRKLLNKRLLPFWDILNKQFAVYEALKLNREHEKKKSKKS